MQRKLVGKEQMHKMLTQKKGRSDHSFAIEQQPRSKCIVTVPEGKTVSLVQINLVNSQINENSIT